MRIILGYECMSKGCGIISQDRLELCPKCGQKDWRTITEEVDDFLDLGLPSIKFDVERKFYKSEEDLKNGIETTKIEILKDGVPKKKYNKIIAPFNKQRNGDVVYYEREIDKENNRYHEFVQSHEDGIILRECDQKLSKHVGHGGDTKDKNVMYDDYDFYHFELDSWDDYNTSFTLINKNANDNELFGEVKILNDKKGINVTIQVIRESDTLHDNGTMFITNSYDEILIDDNFVNFYNATEKIYQCIDYFLLWMVVGFFMARYENRSFQMSIDELFRRKDKIDVKNVKPQLLYVDAFAVSKVGALNALYGLQHMIYLFENYCNDSKQMKLELQELEVRINHIISCYYKKD